QSGQKGSADTTATEDTSRPENGVYYEYSQGGHSDRVKASYTYENGIEIYRNEYEYWGDGNLKSITSYTGDTVTDTWYYNYNEGILCQTVRNYSEAGSECRDEYIYLADGNLSEIIWYTDGVAIGGWLYTYTDKGELSREEYFDAGYYESRNNGTDEEISPVIYKTYSFDEKGRTCRAEEYEFNSLAGYDVYEYSESELLTCIKSYTSRDEYTGEQKYEYNADGELTKMLTCDEKGTVLSHVESLYDENGFHYRDIFYQDGKPLYCYDYTESGARIYSAYK
ncbi:MAG: hypothetical protein IJD22_04765, partial [Clostridia bacterium]|nr:hypothetical protein [Clostridia bacterium]